MVWTSANEQRVTALFELAFAARDIVTVKLCVMELRAMGLAENQIRNGFMAGTLQLALDTGSADLIQEAFTEFANKQPGDARIVLKSLLN